MRLNQTIWAAVAVKGDEILTRPTGTTPENYMINEDRAKVEQEVRVCLRGGFGCLGTRLTPEQVAVRQVVIREVQ